MDSDNCFFFEITFEVNGVKVIDFFLKLERLRCFKHSFFYQENF